MILEVNATQYEHELDRRYKGKEQVIMMLYGVEPDE
jgi:hypothetical protein